MVSRVHVDLDRWSGGAPRRWRMAASVALVVTTVGTLMTLSPAARAAVLSGTPVPVAGVENTFGIGQGQLGTPGGLVLDGKNDIFVADQSNSRVLEYTFALDHRRVRQGGNDRGRGRRTGLGLQPAEQSRCSDPRRQG